MSDFVLRGYAIPFSKPAFVADRGVEVIDRHAFDRTIATGTRVRVLWDSHAPNAIELAPRAELFVDDYGVGFQALVDRKRHWGLVAAITRSKDPFDECSIGDLRILAERADQVDGLDCMRVTSASFGHVSICRKGSTAYGHRTACWVDQPLDEAPLRIRSMAERWVAGYSMVTARRWARTAAAARPEPKPETPKAKEPRRPPTGPDRWRTIDNGWQELCIAPANSTRRVRGIASSKAINSHNYAVDPLGMVARLPIPLRCEHALDGRGVGEVHMLRRNADLVYFEAALDSNLAADHAWRKVCAGDYRAVSLGWGDKHGASHFNKIAVVDGTTYYDRWPGGELSLCRTGANPDARLDLLDGDGSDWRDYLAAIDREREQNRLLAEAEQIIAIADAANRDLTEEQFAAVNGKVAAIRKLASGHGRVRS